MNGTERHPNTQATTPSKPFRFYRKYWKIRIRDAIDFPTTDLSTDLSTDLFSFDRSEGANKAKSGYDRIPRAHTCTPYDHIVMYDTKSHSHSTIRSRSPYR